MTQCPTFAELLQLPAHVSHQYQETFARGSLGLIALAKPTASAATFHALMRGSLGLFALAKPLTLAAPEPPFVRAFLLLR